MPYAAALSEHPVPAHAAGEVIGAVIEQLGRQPDLALLFITASHTGAVDDIARSVRSLLEPMAFVGATASSVLAGRQELEEQPAMVLWAARFADGAAAEPVRLTTLPSANGVALAGVPDAALSGPRTLLLLPDPFTFPADQFLSAMHEANRQLSVVGGLASGARGPGGNRLLLGDQVFTDGAVGVLLPPSAEVRAVVSQGCRPVGEPMTVTKAERNVIFELAGRPALERLAEVVSKLSPDDRQLAARGIHLGRVIDEHKLEFRRGDFLIRNVLGGDRDEGAIALGDLVDVGDTVQFQVRDAGSADEDLRELLAGTPGTPGAAPAGQAALVFTCNGRGTNLFPAPHHDAELVNDAIEGGATAGMFCAGELGPVGGHSFLHGFTASVLLFKEAIPG